jgi:DNA-binding transcriptional LysR family regulator
MDNLQALLPHLPILAAFAEMGQVTGAAEILAVPQPQVSRSLARAEEITGLTLKQRHGREVRPTKDAIRLGEAAKATLTNLENTLNDLRSEVRGSVRLAFQHSLGEHVVPQAISAFVPEHPQVDFTLTQGSRSECLEALEAGKVDAAFIAIIPDSMRLESQILMQEQLVLAVPNSHPLAAKSTIHSDDIADQDLIATRHGLGLRRTTDALLRHWGISPRVTFEGQEISTVLGLVAAGLGITIVPSRAYRHEVTLIPFAHKDAVRDLVLVTSAERTLTTAAARFVEVARALFT